MDSNVGEVLWVGPCFIKHGSPNPRKTPRYEIFCQKQSNKNIQNIALAWERQNSCKYDPGLQGIISETPSKLGRCAVQLTSKADPPLRGGCRVGGRGHLLWHIVFKPLSYWNNGKDRYLQHVFNMKYDKIRWDKSGQDGIRWAKKIR